MPTAAIAGCAGYTGQETLDRVLSHPELATAMGASALVRSGRYMWSIAAARLRRLYGDLSTRAPVECS